MDYLYDGSFYGLLTCIYWNYYGEKATGIYEKDKYQCTLLNNYRFIESKENLAEKVYNSIEQKISKEALDYIYYCYLSNNENSSNIILDFIKIGYKLGKDTLRFYSHEKILPIHKVFKKVSFERHKFLGLIRFADMKGVLYSAYSPDHNITVLLADHFADRLKNEKFIIHDTKRNIAVIYFNNYWYVTDLNIEGTIEYSENELEFQKLWRGYFNQMAIKERINTNL